MNLATFEDPVYPEAAEAIQKRECRFILAASRPFTVGIDIGLTGAIAAINGSTALVQDIPTIPDGKGRRIDGRALHRVLRELVPCGCTATVLFEDVQARSIGNGGKATNSMGSQGSMMRSRGIVEAVLDITRLPVKVVQPQTWKRHYGLLLKRQDGESESQFDRRKKAESMGRARTLYPAIAHDLSRVKDHNRAEALLIAHYGAALGSA